MFDNPFTEEELLDMYNKQKNKIPFRIIKEVKDKDKKKWDLYINGSEAEFIDIWPDGYYIGCDAMGSKEGTGFAMRVKEKYEDFKAELFRLLYIDEPEQLSLF